MIDPRSVPVRFTNLKRMAESPAHYLAAISNPFEPSAAMRLGTITHRLLLGGSLVTFDGSRRGKAWESFKADHADEEIFTASEIDQARPMVGAVLRNALAMEWLEGVHEKTIRWAYNGRDCQSTPDVYHPEFRRVGDLKTCRTSKPENFRRDAIARKYPEQLAFYGEALGLEVSDPHVLIAVESSSPYAVTVMRLTERAVEMARRQNRIWMERLAVCETTNEWPGYCQSVVELDIADEEDGDGFSLNIDGEEVTL